MTRRLHIPQLFLAAFLVPIAALALPGAGIVVDPGGQVYFTDTGYGVWKIAKDGRLSKFHDNEYHWMAIDLDGVFSTSLKRLTDGSFIRLAPDGAKPALITSGGLPITLSGGRLYYGRFTKEYDLEIVANAPNGTTSILVHHSIRRGRRTVTVTRIGSNATKASAASYWGRPSQDRYMQ